MPHITPFHHEQSQPLQCSHHYCHIVDQLLHHPMFNVWNTLCEYKSMKRCLLQYLGTWELDPLLISPILQFLRNWGYTQLTRSIIEQFERSESTTKVLAAAQNTWNLCSTTIIGLGEEPCKEKEAEKDSRGFNPQRLKGKFGIAMWFHMQILEMGLVPTVFPELALKPWDYFYPYRQKAQRHENSPLPPPHWEHS